MKLLMKQNILVNAMKEWETTLERSLPDHIDEIYNMTAAAFLQWLQKGQRHVPMMLYSKWLRKEELGNEITRLTIAESNHASVATTAAPESLTVSEAPIAGNNVVPADVAASIEALYNAEPEVNNESDDDNNDERASAAALSPSTWNKKYPEEYKDEFDSDNSSMKPRLFPNSDDDDDENDKKPRAKEPTKDKKVTAVQPPLFYDISDDEDTDTKPRAKGPAHRKK
jgi:hypothetical protein